MNGPLYIYIYIYIYKRQKHNIPRAGLEYLRCNVYKNDYLPADIQLQEAIRFAASPTRWQSTHSARAPRSHSFLSFTSPSAARALCSALKWWVARVYSRDYSAGSSQPSLSVCLFSSCLRIQIDTNWVIWDMGPENCYSELVPFVNTSDVRFR